MHIKIIIYEDIPLWHVDPSGQVFSNISLQDDTEDTMSIDSLSTDSSVDSRNDDGDNMTEEKDDELWDDLLKAVSVGVVDTDEVIVATASSSGGVGAEQLSKVWRISLSGYLPWI